MRALSEAESHPLGEQRRSGTGECGLLDVATLEDEGNMINWSLEMKQVVTRKDLASCSRDQPPPERLSWRNARRPLPCRFVQPGALRP